MWTSYGTFVNGKAVCLGYAEAYKQILDGLGIPCTVESGMAGSSEEFGAHAWNKIMLDGEGYYVDVTGDDNNENTDNAYIDHTYYNADINLFERYHFAFKYAENNTSCLNYAPCVGDKYIYYKREGMTIDSYTREAVQNLINAQSGNKAIYIKFSESGEADKAWDGFENKIFDFDRSLYNMRTRFELKGLIILFYMPKSDN